MNEVPAFRGDDGLRPSGRCAQPALLARGPSVLGHTVPAFRADHRGVAAQAGDAARQVVTAAWTDDLDLGLVVAGIVRHAPNLRMAPMLRKGRVRAQTYAGKRTRIADVHAVTGSSRGTPRAAPSPP